MKWVLGVLLLGFVLVFFYALLFIRDEEFILRQSFGNIQKELEVSDVSRDQIFDDSSWTATLPAELTTSLLVTGDIIPARSVNSQVLRRQDFTWPYLFTSDITKNADITFADLETPLIKNCPVTNEGMIFCGDYRNIEGLVYAGVDVVTLGNNHAGNWGEDGVIETLSHLQNAGIKATGTTQNNLIIIEKNKTKFAFLGFNDISSPQPGVVSADFEKIKTDIATAREQADYVIVQFHWGAEYRDTPDSRQIELGRFAVDHGADLVIGNHPHWVQPLEIYNGKVITYAHGNYIFDQMWSLETREGVLGKYIFYKDKLVDIEFTPIQIDDYGQAKIVDNAAQKEKILLKLQKSIQ
ncbi:MAG: CapA family protein [Candidatus Levybacteria bacterium]|nr:CapA family protein [Candidatus Levybacteria bacterium]